ncbi:MAG TPA: serine/threonine-protein kinase [Polyangiaceae bacterium]|nr:serine/threonine-protein kinase [Polyangiaceae bacterium]
MTPLGTAADGRNGDPRFHRIAIVGQGGMADVWLVTPARGPRALRLYALKELRAGLYEDPDFVSMFFREAKLAVRLEHPNVVRTFEVNFETARPYLLMEWLEGQPLHALLGRVGRRGGLPLPAHVYVLAKTLAALDYVHEFRDEDGAPLGVVHRDVSPHNVFVGYDGSVKLMDFGIAKIAEGAQTQIGVVKGKVGYMAPEQLLGRPLDRRADLFAVGVMLWEALVGQRLTAGDEPPAVFSKRVQGLYEPVSKLAPDAPPALAAVAERAMAVSPDERYASAGAMRADLEAWLATAGASAADVARVIGAAFAEQRQRVRELIEQQTGALRAGMTPSAVLRLNAASPGEVGTASGVTGTSGATGKSVPGVQVSRALADAGAVEPPGPGDGLEGAPFGRAFPRFTPAEKLFGGLLGLSAAAALLAFALREPAPAPLLPQAALAAAPAPTRAPAPEAPAPARAPEEVAREVDLVVWATPEGARVFLDQEPVGATPLSLRLLQDSRPHALRVVAAGFQEEERVVTFARDLTIEFSLKPLAPGGAAGPKPAAVEDSRERPRRGPRPSRGIDEGDPYH